jgi:hypothetical protein
MAQVPASILSSPNTDASQKAAKTLAARNSSRLNQTHVTSLCIHFFFLLLRALTFRRTFFRSSALLYITLSIPGALVELWLERIGRPVFEGTNPPELRRAGEDLDAPGLTEFLWDVLYWTWGCLMFAAALGDWAWSLWVSWALRDGTWLTEQIVIPLYGAYSAYSAYASMRKGFGGMGGEPAEGEGEGASSGVSKRQQKMEKRGGQRVQYRS